MPTVEKTSGGSVYLRGLGRRLSIGDQADVGEELTAYLCEERGDFEIAEADDEQTDMAEFEESIEEARAAVAFDPSEHTNAEIEDLVQDVHKFVELDAIRDLEERDQNRSGALDAIDKRRDELGEA